MDSEKEVQSEHVDTIQSVRQVNDTIARTDSHLIENKVDLGWRSWLVVLVTMFGNLTLVFVVVAAGSVIAFIIRDLGEPGLAGWIIQVSFPHPFVEIYKLMSCKRDRCSCRASFARSLVACLMSWTASISPRYN
jgi:hypothetical protein